MTNPEMAILGLTAQQPLYGYQIEQLIEQRGMREWSEIGFSSIYYILNKLEAAGLLVSEKQSGGDRPARKVYQLTPAGRAELAAAVHERLTKPRPRSGDFDLALANLPALPPAEALAALQNYRAALAGRLQRVSAKQQADRSDNGLPPHVEGLFERSLVLMRAELDWLTGFIQTLDQKPS